MITVEQIAKVCHEVNRAYCTCLGDTSQERWEVTPLSIQDSAITGVEFFLENQNCTPEDMHKSWMDYKIKEGWKYGPEKDFDSKEHPCMVPYVDLPIEQKVKDHLFQTIVKQFLGLGIHPC